MVEKDNNLGNVVIVGNREAKEYLFPIALRLKENKTSIVLSTTQGNKATAEAIIDLLVNGFGMEEEKRTQDIMSVEHGEKTLQVTVTLITIRRVV